jgi:hypothetical protein
MLALASVFDSSGYLCVYACMLSKACVFNCLPLQGLLLQALLESSPPALLWDFMCELAQTRLQKQRRRLLDVL